MIYPKILQYLQSTLQSKDLMIYKYPDIQFDTKLSFNADLLLFLLRNYWASFTEPPKMSTKLLQTGICLYNMESSLFHTYQQNYTGTQEIR